jgi:hypothetical protein
VATIEQVLHRRTDYSSFLIHLTRAQEGLSARNALRQILNQRRLQARNPHCLFVRQIPAQHAHRFNVVCFTEAPLHQIKAFLGEIQGRQVKLGPYGLVFTKTFIAGRGGNPAFYINTYHQLDLRNAALALFQRAQQQGFPAALTRLLPFVNIFGRTRSGGRYDFHWEREWRVVGDVTFNYRDVVVGLCPEDRVDDFEEEFSGVKFISPRWGLDRIMTHLLGD